MPRPNTVAMAANRGPNPAKNAREPSTRDIREGLEGAAEDDMERAYDDYQRNHMLGTKGYESPLFDEDGIIQIDPSTIFGLLAIELIILTDSIPKYKMSSYEYQKTFSNKYII